MIRPSRRSFLVATAAAASVLGFRSVAAGDRRIRVLVWDERQAQQKEVYENFLGNAIAEHLRKRPEFDVTSAGLDDPEQGLGGGVIERADVIVWWGHVKQREVKWSVGDQIVERIKQGRLGLITLHSAHWSTPFIKAMNEKTVALALASLSEEERKQYRVETVVPKAYAGSLRRDARLTPYWTKKTADDGSKVLEVVLPVCVFPAWRHDGKPSHLTTLMKEHPIAAGIPEQWTISQTEMYDEPFHVPPPDELIFEEKFEGGEHFRSGMVWNIGKGRVFYFRPGHETYPVYKEALPLKVVENAVGWMAGEVVKNR
jgi:trehalose utilization protein